MYCSRACISKHRNTKNANDPNFKLSQLLNGARHRAKRDRRDCDITLDFLKGLYYGNQGRCALTKRVFDWSRLSDYPINPNAMTLDRIDPSKGYTVGNVRLITYHTNIALNQFGLDALLALLEDLKRG